MRDDRFYIPFAQDPWNEIQPHFWQGGMYFGSAMTECPKITDQFDAVVSMAGKGGLDLRPTCEHHAFYIDDGKLGRPEALLVGEAVGITHRLLDEGKKVLVRCQAGYNRSGLVVALTLRMAYGMSADEAIDLIRTKRSPHALCNLDFVEYINEWV